MNKKIIIGENLTEIEIQKENKSSNKKCYGFYCIYIYYIIIFYIKLFCWKELINNIFLFTTIICYRFIKIKIHIYICKLKVKEYCKTKIGINKYKFC